jgi:hypothetical protein
MRRSDARQQFEPSQVDAVMRWLFELSELEIPDRHAYKSVVRAVSCALLGAGPIRIA